MVSRLNIEERLRVERAYDELIAEAKAKGKHDMVQVLQENKERAMWNYRD